MNKALHFSTGTDDWQTPPEVFDPLDAEFNFGVDLAAEAGNARVCFYFGPDTDAHSAGLQNLITDALIEPWHKWRGPGWCNPPYSRGKQAAFIAKAAEERRKGFTTVMLLPARPDTKAFHTHIYDAERRAWRDGIEVRFVKGRIRFVGAKYAAPFPSMIVIFHGATE